jgi:hypothetical protein
MLNALLLFAAATMTGQDRVEKFPIKYLSAEYAYARTKDAPNTIVGLKRVTFDPTDGSLVVQGTPEAIREFGRLLASIDFQSNSQVVPIKNVDAQYLYELLTVTGRFSGERQGAGILPPNVSLAVDVHANGIVVTGPDAGIREMELLIAQFDIKPVAIGYDIQGSMPLIGQSFESSGKVVNNSSFHYFDERTATSVVVNPRVNGDKTITAFVTAGTLGSEGKVIVRVKPGETVFVRVYPGMGTRGGPTVLAAYGTGSVPAGFLEGTQVPREASMFVRADGPIKDAPKSAELRLVLKFSLPEG